MSLAWIESLESQQNLRNLVDSDENLKNIIRIFKITSKSSTYSPVPNCRGGAIKEAGVGKNGQKTWENFETRHRGYVKWV